MIVQLQLIEFWPSLKFDRLVTGTSKSSSTPHDDYERNQRFESMILVQKIISDYVSSGQTLF